MCGIAGVVDLRGRTVDPALARRLCAPLAHRGPDDEGYHAEGPVALGQRRLAILDLPGGRQPMSNEDGTVWITFNGEIYNFAELRRRLEGHGHRFATRSDTEVIVHAYEQHGVDCLNELRGMFAFALWDRRSHTLVLARDRVGKKPLFYAEADGQWMFASELQGLLAHPGLRREIDWTAVDDYLTYGYIPAPRTIFRHVYKVPPAHYVTLKLGTGVADVRVARYWRLAYGPKLALDEGAAAEGLLEVLSEAVRLRMIADVPLGALLSGGIDSSLVVALMSRISDRPVKTFSIGFDEREFDELAYARLVARRYATEHQELVVRPDAMEVLPTLVRHYGEPFADSSAIATYYVAKLTREHVTVALNGDGADECLAGYERYAAGLVAERYRKIPALIRRLGIGPMSRLIREDAPRRSRLRQARRFIEVADRPAPQRYQRWIGYLSESQRADLYSDEFREQLAGHRAERWLLGIWEQAEHDGLEPLDQMLAVDVESYLPGDLLVKMDIATMANSLEARSPFLDHRVMEFCARLPRRYKLRGLTLKYLLKRAGAGLLPAETLERRKMGFGVPVGDWMRGTLRPWVEDVLFSPRALKRGYFNPDALRQFVWTRLNGRREQSFDLWALLWLELWHQEFMD